MRLYVPMTKGGWESEGDGVGEEDDGVEGCQPEKCAPERASISSSIAVVSALDFASAFSFWCSLYRYPFAGRFLVFCFIFSYSLAIDRKSVV